MKNPFFLIRVQSRGANRLALICAIIAPIIMPICLYLIALNKIGPDQFASGSATVPERPVAAVSSQPTRRNEFKSTGPLDRLRLGLRPQPRARPLLWTKAITAQRTRCLTDPKPSGNLLPRSREQYESLVQDHFHDSRFPSCAGRWNRG